MRSLCYQPGSDLRCGRGDRALDQHAVAAAGLPTARAVVQAHREGYRVRLRTHDHVA
jgi:hypothetical protein